MSFSFNDPGCRSPSLCARACPPLRSGARKSARSLPFLSGRSPGCSEGRCHPTPWGHLPQQGTETAASAGLGCCVGIPHICSVRRPEPPPLGSAGTSADPRPAPQCRRLDRAASAHCRNTSAVTIESQPVQGDDIRPHLAPGGCPLGRGVPQGKLTALRGRGSMHTLGEGRRVSTAPEKPGAGLPGVRTRGGPLREPPSRHGAGGRCPGLSGCRGGGHVHSDRESEGARTWPCTMEPPTPGIQGSQGRGLWPPSRKGASRPARTL